jgi:hypothetical protein
MVALYSVLMLPLAYLTIKVRQVLKKKDFVLPLILLTFTVTLISFAFYNIFLIYRQYNAPWFFGDS